MDRPHGTGHNGGSTIVGKTTRARGAQVRGSHVIQRNDRELTTIVEKNVRTKGSHDNSTFDNIKSTKTYYNHHNGALVAIGRGKE